MIRTFAVIGMLAALLLSAGCAGAPSKVVQDPASLTLSRRTALFPLGVYHHEVKVTLAKKPESGPQSFEFQGVVQIKADLIRVAVLSAFNTTVLKLTEDRKTREVKTEVYSDSFKRLEPKMREYYSTLRVVLSLPLPIKAGETLRPLTLRDDGLPSELEALTSPPAKIGFENYDEQGIPNSIRIRSDQYEVSIRVTGYEI